LGLFVLISTGCFNLPGKTDINRDVLPVQAPYVRKMGTPYYAGGGAVVFVMDQINDSSLKDIADRIIRVFGENNAPLNVAVMPLSREMIPKELEYLTAYIDAGIIDISVDGTYVSWLPTGTPVDSPSYSELKSSLQKNREDLKYYFGESPFVCIFPSEDYIKENYTLLRDAGFGTLCTENLGELNPSRLPLNWAGDTDSSGMFRIPVVGNVDDLGAAAKGASSKIPEPYKKLLSDVDQSLNNLGVAVIEVQPATFLGRDKKLDTAKLEQLSGLIKACRNLGEISTLEAWYKYESGLLSEAFVKNRVKPFYGGGQAIIFRLDDVSKEYNEEVVQAIIELFKKNGVPLDLGIVSNAYGTNSYEIPWILKYLDEGVVGISVHGYDWTYFQIDTTSTYLNYPVNDICSIDWARAKEESPEPAPTYRDIKYKLLRARDQYLKYYGVSPVAFTVPTDFYDEAGYKAVQDAGFKVFSTQSFVESRPSSTYPVDFSGKRDPNGMYRIPTASDVCIWEQCSWGNIFDISNQASIQNYCQYQGDWAGSSGNDFTTDLCSTLGELGVAAIGLHPDCFLDRDSNLDKAKLEKLDAIIKWVKTFATITTFEQWYNYTERKK
jgi:hypothetical protein